MRQKREQTGLPGQLSLDLMSDGEFRSTSGGGSEMQSATTNTAPLALTEANASLGTNGLSGPDIPVLLMEEVVAAQNMRTAMARVVSNRGSAGVDAMTVDQLPDHLQIHWPVLRTLLLEGRYKPQPVLRTLLLEGRYKPQPVRHVDIPKPDGGMRQLGIPTVVDRLIQQAISQVLEPYYDPMFSDHSYGFRPGKSAHQALEAARQYVSEGDNWVVDIDLERFFDRVNHDVLMGRLATRIGDKRLLRLIRSYLEAGLMSEGVVVAREEGTPQGGPLSPLLSNILLDDLDKMLEQRGHRFCRYADDCNIYVGSRRAGERVMASVTQLLERKLRLKVNRSKSAVAQPKTRKFLGQRVLGGREHTYLGIHPKSVQRAKDRIRAITRRNRGVCLDQVLRELSSFTGGWLSYHRHCRCSETLRDLDQWVRRRLRCYIWKQWKLPKTRARNLRKMGIGDWLAYGVAYNGHGPWKVAGTPALTRTLTNQWLRDHGFASLQERHQDLKHRALASA